MPLELWSMDLSLITPQTQQEICELHQYFRKTLIKLYILYDSGWLERRNHTRIQEPDKNFTKTPQKYTLFNIYRQERIASFNKSLIKAKGTYSIDEHTIRNSQASTTFNIFP